MAPGPVEELAFLDLERSNKGASKQRRDQINGEISTMRDLLPLQESARQRLSQLQIMSLSCVYIRKCNILQKMLPTNRCSIEVPCEFSSALTGFLLVTTRDGKLIYISENVTEYLGHSMVDMKTQGDSLFDIVDKRDHGTVQAQLLHGVHTGEGQPLHRVSFFCRMNMSRTLKRQGGFGDVKVMHVKGRFVPISPKESGSEQHVFMALCSPLITPDVKESLIQNNTMIFKSVHKLDMTFIEMTETAEFHLGYNNAEVQRQSWYSMVHPEDLSEARAKHMQLIKSRHEMGCMMTVRMLTKSQQVIWVNIVMHVKQALVSNSDDPVVVCINQVVSEEEAKQFKIQGQLFALYAARAPDIFFGGHNFPPMQAAFDPEMMASRPQMLLQQPPFFPDNRLQFSGNGGSQTPGFGHPPIHYGSQDGNFEMASQRPQGHTSTIKALKRKLQENFISSCKPAKIARFNSVDTQGGNGNHDLGGAAETKYVMNVNVYSHQQNGLLFGSGGSMGSFCSETVPMVYQAAQLDPVHAIRNKKELLVKSLTQPAGPDVMSKLGPHCTQEQVVPEVAIPDCYLTPDPSPATSPRPGTRCSIQQPETHQIKHLTTFVMERLNELKERQAMSESSEEKTVTETKKKNLPVIDATFVESFFDDLGPIEPSCGNKKVEIKMEPMSPHPVPMSSPVMRSCSTSPPVAQPVTITSTIPIHQKPPRQIQSHPQTYNMPIKEEFTLEDCTDLEELLSMVGSAGPSPPIIQPCSKQTSPKFPAASLNDSYMECSPTSSYQSAHGSPLGLDTSSDCLTEMSPGSSSPCYDGRDDLLEPDNWLLEPISLSLDMGLPELDPQDVKVEPSEDDLYHLKQLLQENWTPCGVETTPKHTQ